MGGGGGGGVCTKLWKMVIRIDCLRLVLLEVLVILGRSFLVIPFTGNIFVCVGIATRERQLQIVFVSNIFGTNDILLNMFVEKGLP